MKRLDFQNSPFNHTAPFLNLSLERERIAAIKRKVVAWLGVVSNFATTIILFDLSIKILKRTLNFCIFHYDLPFMTIKMCSQVVIAG